ncbi:MAG: DGQHR domain-containing protein [Fibromonadales bacterium]|nr:DGQHR domain-containing protein [Fibromonadales bacterium]
MSIIRPASLIRQGNLVIYSTSLKVSNLLIPNFYSIDRLDPENANEGGYQRLLNKGRAKKLADYIINGQDTKDAFLPTSIFMATDKDIQFNPSNNTIEIDISKVGPFNIVDGQHRVEGLKMAAEKDSRVLEFEIPVNIAVNLSEIEQMCHFLIVNTTQKTVEEGIAQRIRARLTSVIGLKSTPSLPKWILKSVEKGEDKDALPYVDYLNSEKNSPWKDRIKMANDESSNTGNTNQKSFVKAIKKYILVDNNPIAERESEDRQHGIFLNYWIAIANIIGDEDPVVLYKYNGVELFCQFYIPFLQKLDNIAKDFKTETMQELLSNVFDNAEGEATGVGHTDFWKKGGKASGLNLAALRKINSAMVKALQLSSGTKIEKEI